MTTDWERGMPSGLEVGTLRELLDRNAAEIERSLAATPLAVDDREALWMKRFTLLRELESR